MKVEESYIHKKKIVLSRRDIIDMYNAAFPDKIPMGADVEHCSGYDGDGDAIAINWEERK